MAAGSRGVRATAQRLLRLLVVTAATTAVFCPFGSCFTPTKRGAVLSIRRVQLKAQSDSSMALPQEIVEQIEAQRAAFAKGKTRPIPWRIEQIKALCGAISQAADKITEAQAKDGVMPSSFAPGGVGLMMGAMGFYLAKIGEWSSQKLVDDAMPPERRMGIDCDWLSVPEPKGLVLNIAPWNAPIILSVLPVLGALAAGNACVIKPPEAAPASSALLKQLVSEAVSPEAVIVCEGGPAVCESLIDLGFDHIMFTGGTAIGKLVMKRAAKTLTPVTLELGGKNPVMIDEMDDAMLAAAVKEIVGTKAYFAGEFCQCHDICIVVEGMWDRFLAALEKEIEALGDRRMVRLIHDKHYKRVKAMMDGTSGKLVPSPPEADDKGFRLPVTAVIEPQMNDAIMQDEVFGPFWPVVKVASLEEGMARATSLPTGKPLVSYYYGQNAENAERWLMGTSSGCLAINSGPMRLQSNFNTAIHGVGNSGLGGASIWGEHVFNTFSHRKFVLRPRDGAFAGSVWGAGPYKPSS